MKPIQQVFALVLEKLPAFNAKMGTNCRLWKNKLKKLRKDYPDDETYNKKLEDLRVKEVKSILFDKYLLQISKKQNGDRDILSFCK